MSLPELDSNNPITSALFPDTTVCTHLATFNPADPKELFPEELELLEKATQRRKQEFAAGRLAARKALGLLGAPNQPILIGPRRTPIWPEGYAGSISHAQDQAFAAVVKQGEYQSIGVDIELSGRVRSDLWRLTFREEEINFLKRVDPSSKPTHLATLMFAAKEAFYKAQFPLTQSWVGFHDASTTLNTKDNTFSLKLHKHISDQFTESATFHGRYTRYQDWVIAGLII